MNEIWDSAGVEQSICEFASSDVEDCRRSKVYELIFFLASRSETRTPSFKGQQDTRTTVSLATN